MGRGNLERGSGHNSNRNNNTFFPFFLLCVRICIA